MHRNISLYILKSFLQSLEIVLNLEWFEIKDQCQWIKDIIFFSYFRQDPTPQKNGGKWTPDLITPSKNSFFSSKITLDSHFLLLQYLIKLIYILIIQNKYKSWFNKLKKNLYNLKLERNGCHHISSWGYKP